MFGRDSERLKSFLGTESSMEGDLRVRGIVRVDGNARGTIEADEVILGATGMLSGEIIARKIIIEGRVEGSLRAGELLEIGSRGNVDGDIFAAQLVILEGGRFNGSVQMNSRDTGDSHHNPRTPSS